MSGEDGEDVMCLVDDGHGETGVAILLRDGRPVRMIADADGSDSVRLACATLNGLLTGGVPWASIVTLAADSPRSAFVVEQIADFLEARQRPDTFANRNEPRAPEAASPGPDDTRG